MLDCLPEIESDLSVFHRVEEWEAMCSKRFCRLVPLLPAYRGAVAFTLAMSAADQPDPQLLQVPSAPTAAPMPISPAVAAINGHADLFSFATAGGPGG